MSAGSRRNGTSKTGPFPLSGRGQRDRDSETDPSGERQERYTARRAIARAKKARWGGKATPSRPAAASAA